MNDINKGAVTVIIATAVTSAMILMSGAGNADNSQSAIEKDQSSSIEKTTIEITQENDAIVEVVKAEASTKSEPNNFAAKDASNALLLPPPGPFSTEVTEALMKPQAPQLSSPPVSPEKPKDMVAKKPEMPKAPNNVVEKPIQEEKASIAPKPTKKLEMKLTEEDVPKMATEKPIVPFAPKIPSLQPELKKSPELPNDILTRTQQVPKASAAPQSNALQKPLPPTNNSTQPIWMQGKNSDTAKMPPQVNQEVNKRSNQLNGMQMPNNPYGVRYMQQYRYMPMPVYPNYQYPQMPRYNSGYYFAPVPNQRMQQGMQVPIQQNNMTQNQSPQGENEQKGLTK